MPRPSVKAERTEEILDAFERCVARYGVEGSTLERIAEQGRDVFAVPGSVHNPQSRGCHRLIRDGASLAETPADIVREIRNLLDFTISRQHSIKPGSRQNLEPGQRQLLNLIGYDPVTPLAQPLCGRVGNHVIRFSGKTDHKTRSPIR